MDIKNIYDAVLFVSAALSIKDALVEAASKKTYLRGADLTGAYLTGAYLTGAYLTGAYLTGAYLRGADLTGADLRGAYLRGAYLRGADGKKKKVQSVRVFSGLYRYEVWAVLFEDGSRWVRMGCFFKSIEEWDKLTLRASNLREFPDDGSDISEERVAAFEFAKAAVMKFKLPTEK